MQRTPTDSPSTSPTPGSSKGKGIGKGASNRNQDPPPHDETIRDSEEEGELGDVLCDNKYAKYSLEGNQDLVEWCFSRMGKPK